MVCRYKCCEECVVVPILFSSSTLVIGLRTAEICEPIASENKIRWRILENKGAVFFLKLHHYASSDNSENSFRESQSMLIMLTWLLYHTPDNPSI